VAGWSDAGGYGFLAAEVAPMPWASAAVVAPRRIAMIAMSLFKVMFLLRELCIDVLSMPVAPDHKISRRRPD